MYSLFQLVVFFLFIVLGILRLEFDNFFLLPFINCFSLVVSVLFILFSAYDEVKRKSDQGDREAKLFIWMLITGILGTCIFAYMCAHEWISDKAADSLSIVAFGLSCAGTFFSNKLKGKKHYI
jgi:hypothetical protein